MDRARRGAGLEASDEIAALTRPADAPADRLRPRFPPSSVSGAPPSDRRRPLSDAARRRSLLQGVRQPDRAREDAPDARHARVARRAARRRHRVPRDGCLLRRPLPLGGRPGARRGSGRAAPLRRSGARVRDIARGGSRARRLELCRAGARGNAWARMELGDVQAAIELLLEAGALAEAGVDRCRAGGHPLPPRRLPLQAVEHPDRYGPPRRGPAPRGAIRASVRPPPRRDPALAFSLLPAPARLPRRPRGRRARARARRGAERSEDGGKRLFQASLVAEREGHLGLARSYAERARSRYEEISTSPSSAACSTTSAHSSTCLAGRKTPSSTSRKRSASCSTREATSKQPTSSRRSLRSTSARAIRGRRNRGPQALDMLGGRDDYMYEWARRRSSSGGR